MTDLSNHSKNKRHFWPGVIFTCLGLVFLAPLFYRELSGQSAVGPFFGVCLALTFLIVGILRIIKSREIDESQIASHSKRGDAIDQMNSSAHVLEQNTQLSTRNNEANKRTTPKFIKYVALSPIVPICVGLIVEVSCKLFGFGFGVSCGGYSSAREALAYFGILGWLISLPVAGMLKLVHSASKL